MMYKLAGGKINAHQITWLSKCLKDIEWDDIKPVYQEILTEICGNERVSKINTLIEMIHDNHPEVSKLLNDFINDPNGEVYEYNDNYRLARIDDPFELAVYHYQVGNGCCGYYDDEISIDGVEFKIGFNYGH